MYCRNCGGMINENDLKCVSCDTENGEGTKYCHNCGRRTTEKMSFCGYCGAILNNIIPEKMRLERSNLIQKKLNECKMIKGVLKFIMTGCIVVVFASLIILVTREEPDDIPDPFYAYDLEFGTDSMYQPRDYMPYADYEVQEYWKQGRELILYIVVSAFVFIYSFIIFLIQKKKYKKILAKLEDERNVL